MYILLKLKYSLKKENGFAAYFFMNIIEKISKFSDLKNNSAPKADENRSQHNIQEKKENIEMNGNDQLSFIMPNNYNHDNQCDENFLNSEKRSKKDNLRLNIKSSSSPEPKTLDVTKLCSSRKSENQIAIDLTKR